MEKSSKSLHIIKGVEQPSYLNPDILRGKKKSSHAPESADEYIEGIRSGDRTILARAITLIESTRATHQEMAQEIIEKCLPFSGKSIRLAITGIPGVGKSTFIEALGSYLLGKGHKIAVLAVDPSSKRTKGSILGDKTRMQKLSSSKDAFIRPSPTVGTLGGVARKTRESIILCEAAGFDVVFIETVGVGQSETTVHSMVDVFLLLMLPGAGDELQGMKRGIVELADLIVINKVDDNTPEKVLYAKSEYQKALHLLPASDSGWGVRIETCSSLIPSGMEDVWKSISDYQDMVKKNDYFYLHRNEQAKFWFYESMEAELKRLFYTHPRMDKEIKKMEVAVLENRISPFRAGWKIISNYLKKT